MHGWHDQDVWRQRREDIARDEVRTSRMASAARKESRPARDLKWELSRYGKLVRKLG